MKNMKNRNTALICVIIAAFFYVVNMGIFKLYIFLPMLMHTIFFYIAAASRHKKTGKAFDIPCRLLYLAYIFTYITMPDHKIKGKYYWLFGFLRADDMLFRIWLTALLISTVLIVIFTVIALKNFFTPPWWRKYTVLNLRGGRLIPISADGNDMLRIEYDDGMKIFVGFSKKDKKYYITCSDNSLCPAEIIAVYNKSDLPVEIQKAVNIFRKKV